MFQNTLFKLHFGFECIFSMIPFITMIIELLQFLWTLTWAWRCYLWQTGISCRIGSSFQLSARKNFSTPCASIFFCAGREDMSCYDSIALGFLLPLRLSIDLGCQLRSSRGWCGSSFLISFIIWMIRSSQITNCWGDVAISKKKEELFIISPDNINPAQFWVELLGKLYKGYFGVSFEILFCTMSNIFWPVFQGQLCVILCKKSLPCDSVNVFKCWIALGCCVL